MILKESYIKGGRFSDSEWSRILKAGGLVILNGAYIKGGSLVILNGVVY